MSTLFPSISILLLSYDDLPVLVSLADDVYTAFHRRQAASLQVVNLCAARLASSADGANLYKIGEKRKLKTKIKVRKTNFIVVYYGKIANFARKSVETNN
jgi:hypothetical protein